MPDSNGNLVPGDPTPTTCKRVGMIVPVLLKDDGGTIAKSSAHPEFQGRPLTADFILGDYRAALKEGGLDLCNTDEIAAGKPLRLSVVKFVSHPAASYLTDISDQESFPFPTVTIEPGCNVVGAIGVDPDDPTSHHTPFCRVNAAGSAAWRVVQAVSMEGSAFAFNIVLAGSVATNGDCTGLPNSYFGSRVKSTIPPPPGGMNRARVIYFLQLSPDGTTWNPFTDLLLSLPFPPRNCALGSGADPCPDHGPGSPWNHF